MLTNETTSSPAVPSWTSWTVVSLIFTLGVGITLLLYQHFVNLDQERIRDKVLRGVQTLAAYSVVTPPNPTMLDAFTVLTDLQHQFMQDPVISRELLESRVWKPQPPIPDFINLRYHPKVSYNKDSGRNEMLDLAGHKQPFDIAIIDTDPAGPKPATPRDENYPVMLEATGGKTFVSAIGLNHFYDNSFHIALDEARDAGIITSRTSFPQANEEEIYVIASFFIPLYSPGEMPQTIEERRARHVGFLSAVSFGPAKDYINFLPESYQGLDTVFLADTPAFADTRFDDGMRLALANGGFAHETFQSGDFKTHVYARPSYKLTQAMQAPNRWWALGIGLITTTWLCSILLLMRRNAQELSQLVEQRTRSLKERTTKLVEVNMALTDSEARYKMLADNVSDVIFTTDSDGICTYISPSITQQNGFSARDYLGKPIYSHTTDISREAIKLFLTQAKANPAAFNFAEHYEFDTLCKNGGSKTVEISLTKLTEDDGRYGGVLGISRDISDRKKAEMENAALQEAFRQSQKMEAIGTLAGGVAHDFNNLLTGIMGHAELVRTADKLDPELTDSMEVIETAAQRAKELTAQLLGFARKGQMQKRDVPLNKLVKETIALLERTINKNIRIQAMLSPRPLDILGDSGQITQILLNLAVNARDAMPEGGKLTFETRYLMVDDYFTFTHYEELAPGPYGIIAVTDTGIGIPRDKINRIFEPFFTDKPDGKGTGLGLAMVYGVTKSHGGTVTVYSEEGIGTVFKIYLPLNPNAVIAPPAEPVRAPVTGKGTILVVDDESIVRNLAQSMLHRLGYHVLLAIDGEDALKLYQQHWQAIDLVILDMIMPNMGGRECLELMQKLNPGIKAIISTGFPLDAITSGHVDLNRFGFLQKPYRLQDLSEIVASTMAGQTAEAPTA